MTRMSSSSSLSAHYSTTSVFVCGMACDPSCTPAMLQRELSEFVSQCVGLTCCVTVVVRADERGVRRTAHINFERAKDCRHLMERHRFDVPFGGRLEPAVLDRRALQNVPDLDAYQVQLYMMARETESEAARRAFERVRSAGPIASVTPWMDDRVVVVRFFERRAAVSATRLLRQRQPKTELWNTGVRTKQPRVVVVDPPYRPDCGCVLRTVWRMSLPAVFFDRHQH